MKKNSKSVIQIIYIKAVYTNTIIIHMIRVWKDYFFFLNMIT